MNDLSRCYVRHSYFPDRRKWAIYCQDTQCSHLAGCHQSEGTGKLLVKSEGLSKVMISTQGHHRCQQTLAVGSSILTGGESSWPESGFFRLSAMGLPAIGGKLSKGRNLKYSAIQFFMKITFREKKYIVQFTSSLLCAPFKLSHFLPLVKSF